jgi:hypothetical protein
MIMGLPVSAWILIILSGGIGLALVIPFYLAHRPEESVREAPNGGEV